MKRLPRFLALLALTAGALPAQELSLTFDPPNPVPGQPVSVIFPDVSGCAVVPVLTLRHPGAGNGQILIFNTRNAGCGDPSEIQPYRVAVGPLRLGTYLVRVLTLGTTLSAHLAVSRHGAVTDLQLEPASPVAGQPFTLSIDTGCRSLFFRPPRVVQTPSGPAVEIEIDPDLVGPPVCPPEPTRIVLGPQSVGSYRLRVLSHDGAARRTEAERVFAVVPPAPALPLRQGRFRMWTEWTAPGSGRGYAAGVALTGESGYFTFASPSNVELVAKVLNGCALNDRYWLFLAGLTDLAVAVHVEDTLTGRLRTYESPAGRAFRPVEDTGSFDGCVEPVLQGGSQAESQVGAFVER